MAKQIGLIAISSVAILCAAGMLVWHKFSDIFPRKEQVLSTQTQSATTVPKTVKAAPVQIRGCATYIEPPSGALVEPRVLTGASIEDLRQAYGKESNYNSEIREWEWKFEDFDLQGWANSKGDRARAIGINTKPGHIVATPDGIELGKDTFANLLQKMKDRGVTVSEKMEGADGTWILFASFPSVCNPENWSEYSWYMKGTPAIEDAIGDSIPFRSNIFLNKVVSNYSTGVGKESDGDVEGQPATHE